MKNNNCIFIKVHWPAALLTVVLLIFLSFTCSTDMVSGTSGSETGNGIIVSGCIVDSSGKYISNVQVILLPNSYDPYKNDDTLLLDTTDDSGKYSFLCDSGNYTLQSSHLYDGMKAYSDSVIVDTNEIVLPDDTLTTPGSIQISPPDDIDLQNGYFYIPGTTIYSFSKGSRETIVLDSVPAACIDAVCYAETDKDETEVIRYNVQVVAGDTMDILYPEWDYAKSIYLNTSSSGTSIENNVINVPVLVRLTGQNFSFDQSFGSGSDLLFTNAKGVQLPFDIERWDTDSGIAEVWVNVDTVRGNSDSQFITMLWGNPSISSAVEGAKVFDTANGFQGVWHLNEDPSSGTNAVKDRTFNQNHGTQDGNEIGVVNGVISRALRFSAPTGTNGSSVKLPDASNLDYHDNLTISCWLRLTENSIAPFYLVGKFSLCEDNNGECIVSGYALFCNSRHQIELQVGMGTNIYNYLVSDVDIADTNWHYIVGMVYSGGMALFIDDIRKDCTLPETPVPSLTTGFIGAQSIYTDINAFIGEIDEVRICNTVRTSDWIRLNYLNQKSGDALVMWK